MNYRLEYDGSCWPNPHGTAGYGFVVYENNNIIKSGYGIAGYGNGMSNNYAEYFALCEGLEYFLSLNIYNCNLDIFGDSMMVTKQMNSKKYQNKVEPFKNNACFYVPQAIRAINLIKQLKYRGIKISFNWNKREENQICDELSKKALPEQTLNKMKKFYKSV